MADEPTPLAALIRESASIPRASADVETDESPKSVKMSMDERAARCHELRMRGVPVTAIARSFEVSPRAIYKWLQHGIEQFRSRLEQQPAADLLSEQLQFLDSMEEMCLFEASQADVDDSAEIDPATGKVTRKLNPTRAGLKLKYMQAAMSARAEKIKLLTTVGVLPKEPERIYHSMADEKRDGDTATETKGRERSAEEIKNSIMQYLSRGRSLT